MARCRRLMWSVPLAVMLLFPAVPAAAAAVPAAPVRLHATNGTSSIRLSWEQPATGVRPHHFRVYEGDTVVARNTTTHVTVTGLGFGSTHTFRVAAVTAGGAESPRSEPVTRQVWIGGAAPVCEAPGPLTAVEVTPTAVSLAWPAGADARVVRINVAGRDHITDGTSLRVGGLRPGATYDAAITPLDCDPPDEPGPPLRFTTPPGPSELPGPPAGLRVAATQTTISLSWSAPAGGAPVDRYAVFSGGTRIGTSRTTSLRLTGLWRDTGRPITVAALSAAGAESSHTDQVTARTLPCAAVTPAPTGVQATAVSPSSVELSWISTVQASGFTVYDGAVAVAEVRVPSARITGLASGSQHRFRVVTHTVGCPDSPAATARARTPDGPAARPAAPTGLRAGSQPPMGLPEGHVSLEWDAPAGDPPARGYRIYEGATLIGASTGTSFTGLLPPATTHRVVVVAVDAAGNESSPSNAAEVTALFYPPPAPPPGSVR